MGRSQTLKLAMLDDSQEFGLQFQRQFPDFVEAKGGTIGHFKPADPPGIGPCKRALFTAE